MERSRPHPTDTVRGWKNRLLFSLIQLFAKKKSPLKTTKNILIVSTTALGDTLWATPAIASLKKSFPQAKLSILTNAIGQEIFAHNPNIDALYLCQEPLLPRFFSLLKQLKAESFDTALIFHASQRLILPLCALSSIPRIVATKGLNKGLDALLTHPIRPRVEHEIERRFSIIEAIGATRGDPTLSIFLQPKEREQAKKRLPSGIKIALHPGSKEAFRRWPSDHFATLGQWLKKTYSCSIYITGTANERPILEAIQKKMPEAILENRFASSRQLAAFLEQMNLVVSNDTGPFHLACALNIPVIGLYVSTNPKLCGSHRASGAKTLFAPPTCTPCLKRKCKEPFCFFQISPKIVFLNCQNKLK